MTYVLHLFFLCLTHFLKSHTQFLHKSESQICSKKFSQTHLPIKSNQRRSHKYKFFWLGLNWIKSSTKIERYKNHELSWILMLWNILISTVQSFSGSHQFHTKKKIFVFALLIKKYFLPKWL